MSATLTTTSREAIQAVSDLIEWMNGGGPARAGIPPADFTHLDAQMRFFLGHVEAVNGDIADVERTHNRLKHIGADTEALHTWTRRLEDELDIVSSTMEELQSSAGRVKSQVESVEGHVRRCLQKAESERAQARGRVKEAEAEYNEAERAFRRAVDDAKHKPIKSAFEHLFQLDNDPLKRIREARKRAAESVARRRREIEKLRRYAVERRSCLEALTDLKHLDSAVNALQNAIQTSNAFVSEADRMLQRSEKYESLSTRFRVSAQQALGDLFRWKKEIAV